MEKEMSQATQPEPAANPLQAPADVGQSLFWDDVRAGLKIVGVGVILIFLAELSSEFRAGVFLTGAFVIAGGLLSLIGLGLCTAIPKETGARPLALGAAGCAAFGLVALPVLGFPVGFVLGALVAFVLGAVALMLFALVLRNLAAYIGHRPLTSATQMFVGIAAVFAFVALVFALVVSSTGDEGVLTGETEFGGIIPALRALVDLLAIGVVGNFVYLAWGAADSIARVRQGLPMVSPRKTLSPEELAAEELRLARENITYTPGAPPHFSDQEVHFFHADDTRAAGWIVGLMGGIFVVGVFLYLIVVWSVAE
jgi:hypothetical protein